MTGMGSGNSRDERSAAIGSGLPLAYKRAEDCPDAAKHTKSPDGYLQWHAWAEKKAKTHTQHQCPTCGFWAIWKRKKPTPTPAAGLLSAQTGTFKAGE